MLNNIFRTILLLALLVQANFSFAGKTSDSLEQTLKDLQAFEKIAQTEEGQWLSYADKNGDVLKRLLSTERVLAVYESSDFVEADLQKMAEITEGLKPYVKSYTEMAMTAGGAYQEEFIDMYELTYYYALLGTKALESIDIETGDADMDEMFTMLKAMMKPVAKMMAKGFKSIIDKGVFVGESKDNANAAYATMQAKNEALFGG